MKQRRWGRPALLVNPLRKVPLLEFSVIEDVLANQGTGRVRIATCHACTCYGPLFMKYGPDGQTVWHEGNEKPSYLSTASQEWDAFPEVRLVMISKTRHFLQAVNWSMMPGVACSQIGGLPTWIQDAKYPACADCTRKMPVVGQISNEDFMEYGEGIHYTLWCPQCNITTTCYE